MKDHQSESTVAHTLAYAGLPVLMTWLFLPLTFLLPTIDSTRAPYFDLTGTPAQIAYWFAWENFLGAHAPLSETVGG